jgi:hypothetical protein
MKAARRTFFSVALVTVLAGAGVVLPASASYATSYFEIYNYGANMCLGNTSHGQSDIGPCTGDSTQTWSVNATITLKDPLTGKNAPYSQFKNVAGKCIGLAGSTGPQVVVGPCSATTDHSQFWSSNHIYFCNGPSSPTCYTYLNGHTGSAMGTANGGTTAGTLVQLNCLTYSYTCEWQQP